MQKESTKHMNQSSVLRRSIGENRSSPKLLQQKSEKSVSFQPKQCHSVRNSFSQIVNPGFEKFLSKYNLNDDLQVDTDEDSELLIVERLYREHKTIKQITQN